MARQIVDLGPFQIALDTYGRGEGVTLRVIVEGDTVALLSSSPRGRNVSGWAMSTHPPGYSEGLAWFTCRGRDAD